MYHSYCQKLGECNTFLSAYNLYRHLEYILRSAIKIENYLFILDKEGHKAS